MTKVNVLIYQSIKKSKFLKKIKPALKTIGLKKVLISAFKLLQRSTFKDKTIVEISLSQLIQFKISVNPEFGEVDWYIYQHKIWEKNITKHFTQTVKPNDVVIDIGANIGYFTLLSAMLTGNQGSVHAFEPQKEIYSALTENISLNNLSNVITNNLGLGSKSGTLTLTQMPGNRGGGRILENQVQQGISEKVKVISLDQYVENHQIGEINFIKIDVEGFEYEVLQGANRVFSKLKPSCLFEFSPDIWKKNEMDWISKSNELLTFFLEKGYNLQDIDFDEFINQENLDEYVNRFELRRQSNIMATPNF
ncbi:MAG: hypothetical protein COW03_09430 [Cytophagales bacterium CG12_big_fil_rev_8_21_14_0_65_40_12]|nr:MAG: hypothetical protein COW03_09430 [Cytophagales bacterium CG12_big_fil_rev_8_21_14_0_65_40_12]PIW05535.1 MAG: hypothetical protein COW40_03550 [Cytophagales bacterium CG17_big_fil_post_rev_8_21_14_2_50_40_13]